MVLDMSFGGHTSSDKYHNRRRCAVCPRKQETFVCINCGCSYYCSRQCKKLDEPVHQALCKPFEKLEDRPSESVRRAIYFPVDSPLPKFVWLQMDQRYDHRQPNLDDMRKNFLGDPQVSDDYVWPVEVDKDFVYMTEVNPSIILGWGSKKPSTDQPLNQAITMLICNESHGVRGPIIAYGQTRATKGLVSGTSCVTDLDTTDFTVIVNYFLGCHREIDTPMKAVRIFSNGEQSKTGYHFEPGFLLSSTLFCEGNSGITSQISVLFGMPLVLVSPLLSGLEHTDSSVVCDRIDELRSLMAPDKGNRIAARLLIDIGYHEESSADEFGTIPEQYVLCFLHASPLHLMHS